MKIVGFLGAYEKTDLIIYIAKMLEITSKKVLVIDTTINQRLKYIVPAIDHTFSYVTNFQGIDIAVGFNNYTAIAQYLKKDKLDYDFILVDVDNSNFFERFMLPKAYKNYFVTSFGLYSIKKGIEILQNMQEPINLTKVLFAKDVSKEENEYLNYLTIDYKVNWEDFRIYFPLEKGDKSAIIDNEKLSRIRFKNLSTQYRQSLEYIAEELLGQQEVPNLVRALKNFEKKD